MQEARSAAYFTHYTNLFGSLSHQEGDSCIILSADVAADDAPLILWSNDHG